MNINNITSLNNYGNISNNGINKINNLKNGVHETDTAQSSFDKIMSSLTDKTSSTYEKFAVVKMNHKGTKVFDLNGISEKLQNALLSTDVNIYFPDETGVAIFRCFFQKPNSVKPIIVDVTVPNYNADKITDNEILNNSIEKAIMLLDKKISIGSSLGDKIADSYGAEFNLKYSTGELDFKPFIDGFRNHLNNRLNGDYESSPLVNSSVDQATLLKAIKEFEVFILDYI